MDLIHYVVKDGVLETTKERSVSRQVRLNVVKRMWEVLSKCEVLCMTC